MKHKLFAGLAAGVVLLVVSGPMFAHHSMAEYDREHPVTLTGTVTKYELINPHAQIHFDVKDENGTVVKWISLSGNPQRMYRAGWNKESLKPGDKITVTGAPIKDGRKMLSVVKLVTPSGLELTQGAE